MSARNTEDIVADIFRLEGQSDSLAVRRKKAMLMQELLRTIPQGHNSGLNADMLDDMHAEDIIKKARVLIGGGGGATPYTLEIHGNAHHDPDLALANHAHIITTTLSFAVVGDVEVDTDVSPTIVAPCALTIVKVKVVVKTAPTGSSLIVDVNKAGTTIFTTQGNRPEIAIGATQDDSGTPDVTALAEGDKVTIDVDQIGSAVVGADLTVEVVCTQSVV